MHTVVNRMNHRECENVLCPTNLPIRLAIKNRMRNPKKPILALSDLERMLDRIPISAPMSSSNPTISSPMTANLDRLPSVTILPSRWSITSASTATPPIAPAIVAVTYNAGVASVAPNRIAAANPPAAPIAACVYPIIKNHLINLKSTTTSFNQYTSHIKNNFILIMFLL